MRLTTRTRTLHLASPFRIARSVEETVEVVECAVAHDGIVGRGEGAPASRYGESAEHGRGWLDDEVAPLLGDDPFALEEVLGRATALDGPRSALCALDGALHDLVGRLLGRPLRQVLGLTGAGPQTSWTIWLGEPDEMAARAATVAAEGRFGVLKVKLGGRDGADLDRVRLVREAAPGLRVRVDVNEAWVLDEALAALPVLAGLGVELLEQPLPADHPQGAVLKAAAPPELPIYLDEDVHTAADVVACAERAHGVNLKLAKTGGVREALRAIHVARALGMGVMLGCMIESSLGIAPAVALAPLVDHVDVDGALLLADDPYRGLALVDGIVHGGDGPGLGVEEARP